MSRKRHQYYKCRLNEVNCRVNEFQMADLRVSNRLHTFELLVFTAFPPLITQNCSLNAVSVSRIPLCNARSVLVCANKAELRSDFWKRSKMGCFELDVKELLPILPPQRMGIVKLSSFGLTRVRYFISVSNELHWTEFIYTISALFISEAVNSLKINS